MRVFDCDHTLPALPVPELGDTCETLKGMIRPLVDEPAWREACAMLDELAAPGGTGERLQRGLLEWRAALPANSSWLRPFWDDLYLACRDRLPVNMNYAFQLEYGAQELPALMTGLCRAARALRTEELAPEETKGGFLSMDTLRSALYTRIPGAVRDVLLPAQLSQPQTAAVVCCGRWYLLSLCDENGEVSSPEAVAEAFAEIRAGADDGAPCVGALTCAPRPEAAELRDLLQQSRLNRLNLECIEKSLFVVCLDGPGSDSAFGASLICGEAGNRWYDKSLQIITDGERLGMNLEHAGCDAAIWVFLLTQADALRGERTGGAAHVRPLAWNTPEPLAQRLEAARRDYNAVRGTLSFERRHIASASKEAIKARKTGPDTFVQMLYQSAYFRVTGKARSVYEAMSTRPFYQGRTECIRPCGAASAELAQALAGGGGSREELQRKYRAAEAEHKRFLDRCRRAQGPERHMSGLAAMAALLHDRGEAVELPAVFSCTGYQMLKHDAVSTSSTTAPFIDYFGFGPVVEDGIGIGYGVKGDALHIMVSAFDKSGVRPAAFLDALEECAEQLMRALTD